MNSRSSYQQVLRSSCIIGGANGLNYLVALDRVKIIAVLLGPADVGWVSLYMSVIGLVGTVSGLGIGSSAVREVALAFSQQNPKAAARTVRILRRACWATGLLGWALAAALAPLLSTWVSGTTEHAVAIGVLGVTLFLGAINGGQTALLQGVRRIGDIARANVAYAAVIPKWTDSLINGEPVHINGDGETSRDFCYIANAVQANLLAATAESAVARNQVYNVAVGDRNTLNTLFAMLRDNLADQGVSASTHPLYRDFRNGDVRHSQADIGKAQSLLGYAPTHRLAEGVVEAMPWYVKKKL